MFFSSRVSTKRAPSASAGRARWGLGKPPAAVRNVPRLVCLDTRRLRRGEREGWFVNSTGVLERRHLRDMAKKKRPSNPGGSGSKRKFFRADGDASGPSPSGVTVKSAFETVSHRRKFDILGRKVKGERGNVLQARTEAIEKRRRTLLVEHEANGKANAFLDRRFGEHDSGLSVEEKNIGRLAKARLRQYKNSKAFALNEDDDDDGFKTLTHLGQPLGERDLTAKPSHGDEEDDENLDDEITRNFHFGGGEFEPTLKRGDGEHDVDAPERRKSQKGCDGGTHSQE